MNDPKLACCNFLSSAKILREFALDYGLGGIDWTFSRENLPDSPAAENDLIAAVSLLRPLEVRYHCFFKGIDLGDRDPVSARAARNFFFRASDVVQRVGGRVITIHVGLGRDSMEGLSWENTVSAIGALVRHARTAGICISLENLAWGWTSHPNLYEKLIRRTDCWATLDIGHAAVSDSVLSRRFDVGDFVSPHSERVLNAHIYHLETDSGHVPPNSVSDLEERLEILWRLPMCDWWVLELRQEQDLLQTLAAARDFLSNHERPANFQLSELKLAQASRNS